MTSSLCRNAVESLYHLQRIESLLDETDALAMADPGKIAERCRHTANARLGELRTELTNLLDYYVVSAAHKLAMKPGRANR